MSDKFKQALTRFQEERAGSGDGAAFRSGWDAAMSAVFDNMLNVAVPFDPSDPNSDLVPPASRELYLACLESSTTGKAQR